MPAGRRIQRLQQLILETIAQFLQREVRDPRIGMVSVTRVKLARDLSTAQVGWSCLGDEAQRRTCERGLRDATPAVQRAVAHAIQTRVTPRISFRFDPTLEEAQALEEIFEHLRQERIEHGEDVGEAEDATSGEDAAGDTVS
jgi:ribosome-binding factor A